MEGYNQVLFWEGHQVIILTIIDPMQYATRKLNLTPSFIIKYLSDFLSLLLLAPARMWVSWSTSSLTIPFLPPTPGDGVGESLMTQLAWIWFWWTTPPWIWQQKSGQQSVQCKFLAHLRNILLAVYNTLLQIMATSFCSLSFINLCLEGPVVFCLCHQQRNICVSYIVKFAPK